MPRRPRMRALTSLLLVGAAGTLMSCGSPSLAAPGRASGRAAERPSPGLALTGTAPSARPTMPPAVLSVAVRPFKEPNDYAHRNYCAAGAVEVLLSAWMSRPPGIEAVARAIGLDPRSGATGATTVAGVNALLSATVRPVTGGDRYGGEHVTSVQRLEEILLADLGDDGAVAGFGHAVPVMVQAMTRTMPGWNGWQATHMVTIFSVDLRSHDPAIDTVTYTETPSPMAAYTGPPVQTTSVAQLWVAMQAFLADDPADRINVIR